jgi:hypothetical protein
MSRTTDSHPRRVLFGPAVLLIGLAATGATAQAQSPRFAPTNDLHSAYVAGFTGLDAAGRDLVWRGAVAGGAVGQLIVRLAHDGRVIDVTNRTWPVEGIVFISGEDPRRAFAAEVRGTIDWQAKRATLTGVVSTGYLGGAHIELTADVINDALHSELRLAPVRLAAAR